VENPAEIVSLFFGKKTSLLSLFLPERLFGTQRLLLQPAPDPILRDPEDGFPEHSKARPVLKINSLFMFLKI
jgi:hypothetical protein